MTNENDVQFSQSKVVQCLQDSGSSHNFVSRSVIDSFNIDVSNLPTKKVVINLAGKHNIVENLSCVSLIIKFNEIFDEELQQPIVAKDFFYIFETGHDVIISYKLLKESKQIATKPLPQSGIGYEVAPEELLEEVCDLNLMSTSCESVEQLTFRIDERFPRKDELLEILHEFEFLFNVSITSRFLKVEPFRIDLMPGAKLKRNYARRLSPKIQAKVEAEIEKLLSLGIIRPSQSSVCFPIVVAHKPDGSIRMCIDFRELNLWTIDIRCPMPLISDLLSRTRKQI
jgi:hypothetical protein